LDKRLNSNLPALKSLGDLARTRPVIVCDTREQSPLTFTHFQCVRGTLQTGDYSIVGLEDLFSIERKSIEDIVSCCCGENRSRFERELHRLRGYRFKRLMIIGSRGEIETMRYHSKISPASVLGSLAAWEMRFYCPVIYTATPEEAATQIERFVHFFAVEHIKIVNGLLRETKASSGGS
jgi:DNA excision repair protein ERCC-4